MYTGNGTKVQKNRRWLNNIDSPSVSQAKARRMKMKKKQGFKLYTGIWLIAVLVLLALLWQSVGDARIVNYSGIVRGATQKLVKEELHGEPDDALIVYLDGIIYDLQTGKGEYGVAKDNSKQFQAQLSELKVIWETMKEEIMLVRSGTVSSDGLYTLSQQHFVIANNMVACAEQSSDNKLARSIVFYFFSLLVSISIFAFVNKRNQKELEETVSIDKLTGILNRVGFEAAATSLLQKNPGTQRVIVEFDIDNFKGINEAFGYVAGDQLLCELAAAISLWQEHDCLCARIDADDFVLLTEWTDTFLSELEKNLQQVTEEQKFLKSFGDIHFTFGVYAIDNSQESIKSIMDKANTAHKTAKVHEHKSLVWYDEQLLLKLKQERTYRERIHHGLAMGEFELYLQPKVELIGMSLMGAEALVRWNLPGNGLVFPDAFIPLFEKDGSIADLDYYMLEQSCAYLRKQLDRGNPPIVISVNFSRVTLYQQMFYENFLEIVNHFKLPSHCIEIEVTESAFNQIADSVLQTLSRLRADGFYISMDDFGAGYSNLNMLSKLPIHIMKLDREFIKEIDHNENMKGVIISVVELAHTMGIQVVCEGVEQPEHIAFLQEVGCDYAQGYYFSRPIPQTAFTELYQSYEKSAQFINIRSTRAKMKLADLELGANHKRIFTEAVTQNFPGFLSLRNTQQEIVYLNQRFRDWIAQYTNIEPLGKTDEEIAAVVPPNVAETFIQSHQGSLELQNNIENKSGLKNMIEFKGAPGTEECSKYFDVLKYWIVISGTAYILTVAYDTTDYYRNHLHNLKSVIIENMARMSS